MPGISFFYKSVEFKLNDERNCSVWLKDLLKKEGRKADEINIVFTSDDELKAINEKYLGRSYYTDTISFPLINGKRISGDVFISVDRVRENAQEWNTLFDDELARVLAHSTLHLIGYDDGNDEDRAAMISREDFYLNLRS